jgi:Fe-S cluster assembly ATP-binding protein
MLKLKDVSAVVNNDSVLKNINLEIRPGKIHAILGPQGAGKSALAHVIQGNPFIEVAGSIIFQNKNIKKFTPEKRANLGIFLAFQYPPEIEGLSNKELFNVLIESKTGKPITAEIETSYINLIKAIGLDSSFVNDSVNTEHRNIADCKKGEIAQAVLLQPELIILDEIDTDIDKEDLEYIILMLQDFLADKTKSLIIITHNSKLLDRLLPDYVHVMVEGEIREEGTTELYKRIIEDGYTQFS